MNYLIFSDIHGNALWLEALLSASLAFDIDRFIFLGDAVSYFPAANTVISRLQSIGAECVEGNHDSMLRGEFPIPEKNEPVYQLRKTMEVISEDNLKFVKTWPQKMLKNIRGKRVLFVHGAPDNPLKGYSFEDSPYAEFDSPDLDIVFMGHTHRPWMRQNEHTLLVNVGSAGLPRDIGSAPSFAVFNSDSGEVIPYRLDLDPENLLLYYPNVHEMVRECLKRG